MIARLSPSGGTALVTGGAGFIGSELTHQLVERGWHVTAVDNFTTGRRENLLDLPAGRLRVVEADIRDRRAMAPILDEAAIVFHLACVNLRQALRTPREAHDVNATATLDLVLAAQAANVARFVHVSSSEVYGSAQAPAIDETHVTQPTTAYGASKLAGETYVRACATADAFPAVVVRPFNSFGPRSHHEGTSGEVIPRFVLRALADAPLVIFGDGHQSRDFTYVTDTVRGILLAGTTDAALGQTVNIGSGHATSILKLVSAIKTATGSSDARVEHLNARPGDIYRQCADAALARRLLGFVPTVSLEQGLERLVAWYRQRAIPAVKLLEDEVLMAWSGAHP